MTFQNICASADSALFLATNFHETVGGKDFMSVRPRDQGQADGGFFFQWDDPFLLDEAAHRNEAMIRDNRARLRAGQLSRGIVKAISRKTDREIFQRDGRARPDFGITLRKKYGLRQCELRRLGLGARGSSASNFPAIAR